MIDRNQWQAYVRANPSEPWRWVGAGFSYGEANSEAAVKVPDAERVVLFGKCLPDAYGRPMPVRRR